VGYFAISPPVRHDSDCARSKSENLNRSLNVKFILLVVVATMLQVALKKRLYINHRLIICKRNFVLIDSCTELPHAGGDWILLAVHHYRVTKNYT
jgi:hypothetical protein